jgi:hypothetical protein
MDLYIFEIFSKLEKKKEQNMLYLGDILCAHILYINYTHNAF